MRHLPLVTPASGIRLRRAANATILLPDAQGYDAQHESGQSAPRYAMHRIHYPTIIVLAIILGITAEVSIIGSHGANPFADMSRLIVGSIVWVIFIMIALLLIFLCTRECLIDKAGLRRRPYSSLDCLDI